MVCDDDEKDDVSGLSTFAAAGLDNFFKMSVVTIDDENYRFLSLFFFFFFFFLILHCHNEAHHYYSCIPSS
jgi:hypothetical protein